MTGTTIKARLARLEAANDTDSTLLSLIVTAAAGGQADDEQHREVVRLCAEQGHSYDRDTAQLIVLRGVAAVTPKGPVYADRAVTLSSIIRPAAA